MNSRTSPIRLLIVDNFEPWAHFLSKLIKEDPSLIIAGIASDGHQAIQEVESLKPDLVLLEANLPGLSGIELARRIKEVFPGCHLLFISNNSTRAVVVAAFDAGATGYVFKADILELLSAIESIRAGKRYLSRSLHDLGL